MNGLDHRIVVGAVLHHIRVKTNVKIPLVSAKIQVHARRRYIKNNHIQKLYRTKYNPQFTKDLTYCTKYNPHKNQLYIQRLVPYPKLCFPQPQATRKKLILFRWWTSHTILNMHDENLP